MEAIEAMRTSFIGPDYHDLLSFVLELLIPPHVSSSPDPCPAVAKLSRMRSDGVGVGPPCCPTMRQV
jgi:hypothetical protein